MMPITERFLITSGTVLGGEHARLARNNQDAIGLSVAGETICGVVADGCSEGRASEVGANLAAHWLAAWGPRYARASGFEPRRFAPALARGLIRHLEPLARSLSATPGVDPAVVQELFLFTFLMVVMTDQRTTIFGVGDGVFSVDGATTVLDAGPGNAPPYLGYRLLAGCAGGAHDPAIHFDGATQALGAMLIATDGAADLDLPALLRDDSFLRNRTLLHKRLRVLAKERRLDDDTTAILIRRRSCGS